MNFFTDGLDWLQEQRQEHTTIDVVIGTTREADGTSLKATLTQSQANTVRNGVQVQITYYHFVFRTADIAAIPINRNVRIWANGLTYQVAKEGGVLKEPNDPLNKDTIVTTVLDKTP